MASAKYILIKESISRLKTLSKSVLSHHRQKLLMLIIMKNSEVGLSKRALSELVGVDPNTIQKWRMTYEKYGIDVLLSDGRVGFKPSLLNEKQKAKVLAKLSSKDSTLTSYKDLLEWAQKNIEKSLKYNSLRLYVKREFGAKLKVLRKSHIYKDEEAVRLFKKTSKDTVGLS